MPVSGNCEICGEGKSKYSCPGCLMNTCSLQCVKKHKKENECNGVRDKTKFVKVKDMTDGNLLSGEWHKYSVVEVFKLLQTLLCI